MSYYTYIIQSKKDLSFYIGSCQDPQERLLKHNGKHNGYTARKQPWKLVWIELYKSKSEAFKREKYLKKQKSKLFLEKLISNSLGT
ncbi:GIY-YIG nuclease family protein [Algoriphagus sp.]|uniref:GIY-YIG nuclease family protein n=1 Tax=Algoriphagus sp. TaxID=1872435 RepID=UPI0025DAC574|nr:GIY-YIG nuclease family protein [Algoriphagus sp.]